MRGGTEHACATSQFGNRVQKPGGKALHRLRRKPLQCIVAGKRFEKGFKGNAEPRFP